MDAAAIGDQPIIAITEVSLISCGIVDQLRNRADGWLDRQALECDGRITSYRQLFGRVDAIAGRLLAGEVDVGERVGFLGKNSDRYFEILLGIAAAGAVTVPIGWRLTLPEVMFIIDDAGIQRLFVEPEFEILAAALAIERPNIRFVSTDRPTPTLTGFNGWLQRRSPAAEMPAMHGRDAFVQLYTSGTTGRPKGVVISHAAVFALRPDAEQFGRPWDRWHDGDIALVAMPIAHVSGTNYGLLALYHGVTALVMREFEVGSLLKIVDQRNVSKIFLVPSALAALLRHPDVETTDFSRLGYVSYGSSPIPLSLLREAIEVMGCEFIQHYGMTETAGTVVTLGPEDHSAEGNPRMRSAGRAEPGVSLRIVDKDLQEVAPGVIGEIMIRCANAFNGYWKRPDATMETLVEGWIRSGDAGYVDDEGYLYIQDRLNDMIISGGENVYPAEVESVLHEHPAIREVAVIGVPDNRWGEAVTAIVCPAVSHGDFDEAAMISWARERLASYKVPKSFVLSEAALPRNASGKVLRRELREPFWRDAERQVA